MPITTASMISAASTGLGRSENSGARNSSVSRTITPEVIEARPGPRAGVVVQRARRQARRHRHPLEQTGTDVRHALGDRLLVDVDPIAVPGGERPGSPAVCENPISTSATAAAATVPACSASRSMSGTSTVGRPAGHVADERHPASGEIEQPRRQQTADHQDEGAGTRGAMHRSPNTTASAAAPTSTVARWMSPSVPATTAAPAASSSR